MDKQQALKFLMDQIESGELTYDDLVKEVQAAIDRREGRAPPLKPKKVRVVVKKIEPSDIEIREKPLQPSSKKSKPAETVEEPPLTPRELIRTTPLDDEPAKPKKKDKGSLMWNKINCIAALMILQLLSKN